MRASPLVFWALSACATTGCILFTDKINETPTVQIDGPARVRRGETVTYRASTTDDASDPLTKLWSSGPLCPKSLDEAGRAGGMTGEELTLVASGAEPFCVWAVVQDRYGARAMASRQVEVSTWTLAVHGPDRVHLAEPLTFEAEVQGEAKPARTTWQWLVSDRCPAPNEALVGAPAVSGCDAATCAFTRAARRPFCTVVVARDELGIEARASHEVSEILDSPPVAQLGLVAPTDTNALGIMSVIRVTGSSSHDPDPDDTLQTLVFKWRVTASPDQRMVPSETCPAPGTATGELCFRTTTPGTYRVELEVLDRAQASSVAKPLELTVDDLPPCIADSEPEFPAARKVFPDIGRSYTFRVGRVVDDGDPYPPVAMAGADGGGQFVWWLKEPGVSGPPRKQFGFLNQFTLEANKYHIGDQLLVRAQYLDRVFLRDPAARQLQSRCDIDAQSCELRSGCYQWVTWTVMY